MNQLIKDNYIFRNEEKVLEILNDKRLMPLGKIYCVGKNYADHAKEMGGKVDNEEPFFFSKPTQSITQLNLIPFPTRTKNLHHEVELVVVLKSECSNIMPDKAGDHIFGYAVGVDLTKRDLQVNAKESRKPWDLSKGFDNSAPISKILKKDGFLVKEGAISLSVNGNLKQSSNISNMVWKVDQLISWLSKYITLKAGDMIFTGTPAGVSQLKPEDKVEAEIENIGSLSFKLVN